MTFFNRDSLLALAAGYESTETTLSPETIALILASSGILENRIFWDEMTDSQWNDIESLIANLVDEIG